MGVGVVLLTTISHRENWGGKLLLYGAAVGVAVYVFCYFLDNVLGDRIRRRKIFPDKLVGVPIYFVGGILGVSTATLLLQAARLMPFHMDAGDLRVSLLIS